MKKAGKGEIASLIDDRTAYLGRDEYTIVKLKGGSYEDVYFVRDTSNPANSNVYKQSREHKPEETEIPVKKIDMSKEPTLNDLLKRQINEDFRADFGFVPEDFPSE